VAARFAQQQGVSSISLSLTHTATLGLAFVVLEA